MNQIQELENSIKKLDKYYKGEIAELKKKEMELIEEIATKEHENDTLRRELEHLKKEFEDKKAELEISKANLAKLHEDHAKEISKVMTDSRAKRRSMRNFSEVSSLRDLSADGGSTIIKKPLARQNSGLENQEGSSGALYTVPE